MAEDSLQAITAFIKVTDMLINFSIDGGIAFFPGLNKPHIIDTAGIKPEEAAHIESLIKKARFFDQTSHTGTAAPGAADYRTFTISIEDNQRSHEVQVNEPVDDKALQELIDYLSEYSVRARTKEDE